MTDLPRMKRQFEDGQWQQFVERVKIQGLRGWTGQEIHFRFPVAAVVGENGIGKSTVLKVAASAYEKADGTGYYPSDFFLSTHWDDFRDVTLDYRIRQGDRTEDFNIRKPSRRWSFPEKRFKRAVYLLDIARTLPLDATAGYAKVARLATGEVSTEPIADEFRQALSHVLGRDYKNARFALPDVNVKRPVGLLEREFGEISNFHQGAGEDSTLDLFRTLQAIPDHSLLLIDEVEASLHPRAQRRLTHFLMEFSRRKRVQIILSTHSPYVLEELPPEARILLIPTVSGPSVVYGASPEFALTRLDEKLHPEAVVYVEDRESAVWLREILARESDGNNLLNRVRIAPVGPANVVKILGALSAERKLPQPGLGVLDGDIEAARGCINLPGGSAPERVVFEGLRAINWRDLPSRFGIGAGELLVYLEDAMLVPDLHEWTRLIGDRVVKSAHSVWEIVATEWCRQCLGDEEKERVVGAVRRCLERGP